MPKDVKTCPHCHQTMMVYKRTIRINMLVCLRKLFFEFGYTPVKVHGIEPDGVISADFEKLRYWGLITGHPAGRWAITSLGVDFILGRAMVRKFKWVYNHELQPNPSGEENPTLHCWDIAPDVISREMVLRDAFGYPGRQADPQEQFAF